MGGDLSICLCWLFGQEAGFSRDDGGQKLWGQVGEFDQLRHLAISECDVRRSPRLRPQGKGSCGQEEELFAGCVSVSMCHFLDQNVWGQGEVYYTKEWEFIIPDIISVRETLLTPHLIECLQLHESTNATNFIPLFRTRKLGFECSKQYAWAMSSSNFGLLLWWYQQKLLQL